MFTQYFGVFVIIQTGHISIRRTRNVIPLAEHIATLNKFDILTLQRLVRMNNGVHSYLVMLPLPQDFKTVASVYHALV